MALLIPLARLIVLTSTLASGTTWPTTAQRVSVPARTLAGRWDLTVHGSDGTYPSWFEVTRSGATFKGRFQGRFGHATALTSITQSGNSFSMLWPDEEDVKARPTEIHGEMKVEGALTGTISAPDGKEASFSGIRAPTLARSAVPRWGKPIDLLAEGLGGWSARLGKANGWNFANGELINAPPSADLISKQSFTDFMLHLEVLVPDHGNSGIYLRGRHEVQVQDDYGKAPYSRGMGGVYGQVTPTSLPAKPAGQWQTFDITFIGRRVTVVLNGVTIIPGREIPGITGGALDSDEGAPGPLMLQGDHTAVRYRNIRVTPASTSAGKAR